MHPLTWKLFCPFKYISSNEADKIITEWLRASIKGYLISPLGTRIEKAFGLTNEEVKEGVGAMKFCGRCNASPCDCTDRGTGKVGAEWCEHIFRPVKEHTWTFTNKSGAMLINCDYDFCPRCGASRPKDQVEELAERLRDQFMDILKMSDCREVARASLTYFKEHGAK